jgi:hypothetical protein
MVPVFGKDKSRGGGKGGAPRGGGEGGEGNKVGVTLRWTGGRRKVRGVNVKMRVSHPFDRAVDRCGNS